MLKTAFYKGALEKIAESIEDYLSMYYNPEMDSSNFLADESKETNYEISPEQIKRKKEEPEYVDLSPEDMNNLIRYLQMNYQNGY